MKKAHLCLQILRRLSFYWTVEFEVSLGEADRSNSKTKGISKKTFCFKVTLCQTLVLYLNDSDLGNRNLVKMTENKENQSVWGPDPCIYNLDSLDMGTWNSDLHIIRHRQCLNRTQSGTWKLWMIRGAFKWNSFSLFWATCWLCTRGESWMSDSPDSTSKCWNWHEIFLNELF